MKDSGYRIFSPVVKGSGVEVVHRQLATGLAGYDLATYSPYWEYMPPAIPFLFRGRRADIIHTSANYGCFFRQRNLPLVATIHGFALDRFMRGFSSPLQRLHYATDLRYFTRLTLERAQVVTAVSEFIATKVTEELAYSRPIKVIYNGVDCERFVPVNRVPHSGVRVLFSGNLRLQKGAELLAEIGRRLPSGVQLLYTQGLRARGRLPDLVQLKPLGTVPHDQMPQIYSNADLLLAPSVREGFGLAVAEAMASGLPVVATDGSSFPELVVHGKGGFLCPLGDVASFVRRITELADDAVLRREMGEFNRERAERLFALPVMLARYRQLFDELHRSM